MKNWIHMYLSHIIRFQNVPGLVNQLCQVMNSIILGFLGWNVLHNPTFHSFITQGHVQVPACLWHFPQFYQSEVSYSGTLVTLYYRYAIWHIIETLEICFLNWKRAVMLLEYSKKVMFCPLQIWSCYIDYWWLSCDSCMVHLKGPHVTFMVFLPTMNQIMTKYQTNTNWGTF